MSNNTVWVGVLNDTEEFYIPSKYCEDDIYKGEDALPYFKTYDECSNWCNNKNANIDISEATLHIELNREEAQNLFTLLTWVRPITDEEIKIQTELHDILVNFLNASK